MTRLERLCRMLLASSVPLDVVTIHERDGSLGTLPTVRDLVYKAATAGVLAKHGDRRPFSYGLHPKWKKRVAFVIEEPGTKVTDTPESPHMAPRTELDLMLDSRGRLSIQGQIYTVAQTQQIGDFMIARKNDWG